VGVRAGGGGVARRRQRIGRDDGGLRRRRACRGSRRRPRALSRRCLQLPRRWACAFVADSGSTVAHLREARDGNDAALSGADGSWTVPANNGSATLRYTFDLGGFARDVDRVTAAVERGGAAMALLSTWLLEPRLPSGGMPVDRHPHHHARRPAGGTAFATGRWWLEAARHHGPLCRLQRDRPLRSRAVEPAGGRQWHGDPRCSRVSTARSRVARRAARLDPQTALAHVEYWQGFTNNRVLLTVVPTTGRPGVVFGRVVPAVASR